VLGAEVNVALPKRRYARRGESAQGSRAPCGLRPLRTPKGGCSGCSRQGPDEGFGFSATTGQALKTCDVCRGRAAERWTRKESGGVADWVWLDRNVLAWLGFRLDGGCDF